VKAGMRKRNGSRTPPLSCSECGHRLVTGSVVGRSQTGYQLPRFKPVLGH
jgi:hypothetical protein